MATLKEAFDAVQADEALKRKTNDQVLAAMRQQQAPRRQKRWWPLVALAICLLAAVGLGGHHLYFTPTTVLSIDVNPSLEMDINRFDRVIALNGYNDDGVALAEELDVKNMSYHDAVDALMANETIENCLANDEELSIAVVETNDAQGDAVLQYVSACTAEHANAHCYALDSDHAEMADAHAAGLSCGKYHAYQELKAYDPSITADEVQQMTMREIRERIAAYESGSSDTSASSQSQNGNGAGNGYGSGSGNGNGMGYGHGHGGHHGQGHE